MGVKRNFMFSAILTASNYIFPFIIYPYVARVLGVNNIGICNYVDSIVNYAVMVSMMGILVVGTREIAKAAKSQSQLNATFSSLFLLCLITTTLASAGLITATFTVTKFAPYKPLLLMGLIKLWGNFLLIEWFFRGMEDFKFITMRTIAVKTMFLVAVFIFVRAAADYPIYYLLLCLSMAFNALFACYKASRMVKLQLDFSALKYVWKPFLILGLYMFLNSMYINFNVFWLGYIHNDTQVGYYTTSTKIFQIILAIYTAYSTVVMPRASAMLAEGRKDEFKRLISKSVDGLILFAVPVAMFMGIFAKGVVDVIAGAEYSGSILPMQIEMPLLFIIGYEQILVLQILTPMSRDRAILTNSVVGATIGLILNFLIVKTLASVGSSIVWTIAEISVLISAQVFVTRYTGLRFPFKKLAVYIAAYLPAALASIAMTLLLDINAIVLMLIGAVFFAGYFWIVQTRVLSNDVFNDTRDKAKSFISQRLKR